MALIVSKLYNRNARCFEGLKRLAKFTKKGLYTQDKRWDGITAIRSLDFVQKIQKIIVISAYLDSATLQELNSEPLVVGWLEKPFDPNELVKMIHKILGS